MNQSEIANRQDYERRTEYFERQQQKVEYHKRNRYIFLILKILPNNENDILSIVEMCKEYFQQLHDIDKNSLPKINCESKQIIDTLCKVESRVPNSGYDAIPQNLNDNNFSNMSPSGHHHDPSADNSMSKK